MEAPTDFGVPFDKTWCLWTRGLGTFAPTAPVLATAAPPHRTVCYDPVERGHLRAATPSMLATGIVSQIDASTPARGTRSPMRIRHLLPIQRAPTG